MTRAANAARGAHPGRVRIDVPRDRKDQFEPRLVKKGQRRLTGLDQKSIALYADGMTTREIET